MSDVEDHEYNETGEEALKILIATDCHLGFEEKNSIRGEDSFVTFEEILSYGKEHEVDFVLLGGDLFHDNKPSQNAVLKCMDLLRKYCLGTRPNKFQFLSDPKMIFKHCKHTTVNFEDPNLNVQMPVFSIHGNHDDPSGGGQIGSLDLLAVSGLINYFGKWTDLNKIEVAPLLFKKGSTHLALYGLSYIKDQRLSRLLRDGKVDMLRPAEIKDCFNIFVLHQNRAKHSDYSFIPEQDLPDFLDFVLWGHEHECRIDPESVGSKRYRICQPGSSVATSLCPGESVDKYVGILHVTKTKFDLQKLRLQTVRPFVFDEIKLDENDGPVKTNSLKNLSDSIAEYVDQYIEHDMMTKALEQRTNDPHQPKLPLLRLRILYCKEEQKFDTFRLDQKYYSEVANPGDILLIRKSLKNSIKGEKMIDIDDDDAIMEEAMGYAEDEPDWCRTVQGGIQKYFSSEKNKNKLSVLSVLGLNEALSNYVDKHDLRAFDTVIEYEMKETIKYINSKNLSDPEEIIQVIDEFREVRNQTTGEEVKIRDALKSAQGKKSQKYIADSEDEDEAPDSDEQNITIEESPVRGRGRGRRARGARAAAGGRGRAKATGSSAGIKVVDRTISPASSTRTGKLSVQSVSSKQPSIASHLRKLHTNTRIPTFVSDSDES